MEAENLVLEQLRVIRNSITALDTKVQEGQYEIRERLSLLETSVIEVKQSVVHLDTKIALLNVGIDNINKRLDRAERRLEITDQ